MLERKQRKDLGLDKQQQAVYNSLVESYQELVAKAETTDQDVLADLANKQTPS